MLVLSRVMHKADLVGDVFPVPSSGLLLAWISVRSLPVDMGDIRGRASRLNQLEILANSEIQDHLG